MSYIPEAYFYLYIVITIRIILKKYIYILPRHKRSSVIIK